MDKNVLHDEVNNNTIGDSLLVERMSLKDLNEIKDILEKEFDDFWNENILKSELENPNSRYFILKSLANGNCENDNGVLTPNNEIIGFGGYIILPDDVEITNIVIKKSMRNHGYGKKLFENILTEAEKDLKNREKIFPNLAGKLGEDLVISLEVNESNNPAISIYESFGFKKVSSRKKYYEGKYDAIIMSKNLT